MSNGTVSTGLPIPQHFKPGSVGEVWRVAYQDRAKDAEEWARSLQIKPASSDQYKIALIAIDIQNTFCIPGFELFVGGQSGVGAVDDNRRLCEFIYRHLNKITKIIATFDTHKAMQIFHPIFLINKDGENPQPLTLISYNDVKTGKWKFNPAIADTLGISPDFGQKHLLHYTKQLFERGKYDLTVWPYHSMSGGIGHSLVSAFEEAVFFHTIARKTQAEFEIKGSNPLTEHYSALGPEVLDGPDGKKIDDKSTKFLEVLKNYDAGLIAGQAKSHCLAWTIDDLLGDIRKSDEKLARKVYLLEDCTTPIVVPGVIDYTQQADEAFRKFAQAGMHIVRTIDPIDSWLVE